MAKYPPSYYESGELPDPRQTLRRYPQGYRDKFRQAIGDVMGQTIKARDPELPDSLTGIDKEPKHVHKTVVLPANPPGSIKGLSDEFVAYVYRKFSPAQIDTTHDIPYLAGYSSDGKTLYVDKDLPDVLSFGDKTLNPQITVALHEMAEWVGLHEYGRWQEATPKDGRMTYSGAHRSLAIPIERAVVNWLLGGDHWDEYQAALKPYADRAAAKKEPDLPSDLDLAPYADAAGAGYAASLSAMMQKRKR